MKTIIYLATIALVFFTTSCGSTKQVSQVSNQQGKVAIEKDPCLVYKEEKPAQRGYGIGTHYKQMTARNFAELQARGDLARAIQNCIETTTSEYGESAGLYASDTEQGNIAEDQGGAGNDRISGMAKELIRGAIVSKTSIYQLPNKQYEVHVCVEYSESVSEIATKVAKSFSEMLTEEQKLRLKFNEQEFKKQQEKAFANYKGATM